MLYLHDLAMDLLFAFMFKGQMETLDLDELVIAYYLQCPQNHQP